MNAPDVLGVDPAGENRRAPSRIERDTHRQQPTMTKTNIVTCGTAITAADPFTRSRVKSEVPPGVRKSGAAFGVDHMVATNLLTAENIARVIGLPGSRDVETFVDGQVQMGEFEVRESSPIADQTVAEADRSSH